MRPKAAQILGGLVLNVAVANLSRGGAGLEAGRP